MTNPPLDLMFQVIGYLTTVAAVGYFGTLLIGKTVLYVWQWWRYPFGRPTPPKGVHVQHCVCGNHPPLVLDDGLYSVRCYVCQRHTNPWEHLGEALDEWNLLMWEAKRG